MGFITKPLPHDGFCIDHQPAFESFKLCRRNRINIPELFFDLDEIAPYFAPLFVILNHRQFFSHVKADDVLGFWSSALPGGFS